MPATLFAPAICRNGRPTAVSSPADGTERIRGVTTAALASAWTCTFDRLPGLRLVSHGYFSSTVQPFRRGAVEKQPQRIPGPVMLSCTVQVETSTRYSDAGCFLRQHFETPRWPCTSQLEAEARLFSPSLLRHLACGTRISEDFRGETGHRFPSHSLDTE